MVRFFSIKPKNTLSSPSPLFLIPFVGLVVVTISVFDNWIAQMVMLAISYVISVLLTLNPFNITARRILHFTRESQIVALPNPKQYIWVKSNKKKFEEMEIKLFEGSE